MGGLDDQPIIKPFPLPSQTMKIAPGQAASSAVRAVPESPYPRSFLPQRLKPVTSKHLTASLKRLLHHVRDTATVTTLASAAELDDFPAIAF
jgi:hypothetical protein